jgi:predicted ATPase/DNA-binding CsgD family transcriptional regulator
MFTMARPPRRLGNVPSEATTFIGRRHELAELRTKLATARLVSLVGPGGVGKTRLAIRAATELGRGFRDGAWFVELADVRDTALVSNAVAAGLDLRDQAATEPLALLLAYLHDKQLLLVLDNCEHLLGTAADLINEVIKSAPGVRVLATSREPLSVPGENVNPVPPLDLPSVHADEPPTQLRQNESVMLFTERAGAASGKFEVTSANQAAVADLCRRLDGLPLAIELAAVRTRVLTVEQILDRLSDRFTLLTGGGQTALPRHRTLRITIDWSHDLLEAADRALLRRLCVFAGRFTLEDIEGVCASEDVPASRALAVLSSLVDKSLVMKEDAKALACYRLHETMREYARLNLREAGEEELLEERCVEYYRLRCQQAAEQARYRLVDWLEWMDLEIDNVRSVIGRCVSQSDATRGLALVTSVGYYWITRATTEGVRWLDQLLAVGQRNQQLLALAYHIRGFLALLQSNPAAARPAFERAMAAARDARQAELLPQSIAMASIAENMAGDHSSAERLLDEAQGVAGGLEDFTVRMTLLQARALNALFNGDLGLAGSMSTEGVQLSREAGDLYSLEMMLLNQGTVALIAGDLDVSKPLLADALRIAQQIDDRIAQYYLLGASGYHAACSGQPRLAAQLVGAAETIRTGAGASVIPTLAPLLAQAEESTRVALGVSKFEAEFQAGKRLGRVAAIGMALGEPAQAKAAAAEASGVGMLGKREGEVARLVAEGLSNKQMGARLFISERTVDGHVRNILNKLGFNSRAQIAAWIASSNQ